MYQDFNQASTAAWCPDAVYMAVVLLVDSGALRGVQRRLPTAAAAACLGIVGRGVNELEANGRAAAAGVGAAAAEAAAEAGQAEDEDVREERAAIQVSRVRQERAAGHVRRASAPSWPSFPP